MSEPSIERRDDFAAPREHRGIVGAASAWPRPPPPRGSLALRGLFVLAIAYTAYITAPVAIPIVAAVLVYFVLSPIVKGLTRLSVPRPLAAVAVAALLSGLIAGSIAALAAPASAWLERAPASIDDLRIELLSRPSPLKSLREASAAVERAVDDITDSPESSGETATAVEIVEPTMLDTIIDKVPIVFLSLGLTMVLSMFLLLFVPGMFGEVLGWGEFEQTQGRIARIASEIEADLSRYLGAITLINLGLALVVAALMHGLGLPNPWLWGALAGALNFAPYLGPIVCVCIIFFASIETGGTLAGIFTPPLVYLATTSIEGQLITPLIVGRRLRLSPIVVLLSVVVFAWVWGVAGALMAVPIVASLRICLRSFSSTAIWARLLGG